MKNSLPNEVGEFRVFSFCISRARFINFWWWMKMMNHWRIANASQESFKEGCDEDACGIAQSDKPTISNFQSTFDIFPFPQGPNYSEETRSHRSYSSLHFSPIVLIAILSNANDILWKLKKVALLHVSLLRKSWIILFYSFCQYSFFLRKRKF